MSKKYKTKLVRALFGVWYLFIYQPGGFTEWELDYANGVTTLYRVDKEQGNRHEVGSIDLGLVALPSEENSEYWYDYKSDQESERF